MLTGNKSRQTPQDEMKSKPQIFSFVFKKMKKGLGKSWGGNPNDFGGVVEREKERGGERAD